MAKGICYETIQCGCGVKNLDQALAEINKTDKRVISVVPDSGGGFMSANGILIGFIIVVAVEN